MWRQAPLTLASTTLLAVIIVGLFLLAAGFVGAMIAGLPDPPGPYDPTRAYHKEVTEYVARAVSSAGGLTAVTGMVLMGITATELEPRVRRGLLVGGGLLLIGTALLLARPYQYII